VTAIIIYFLMKHYQMLQFSWIGYWENKPLFGWRMSYFRWFIVFEKKC
jgi:hypothetical protein